MPPQSKRRRLSLVTLPIVVLVGFLVVTNFAAWQRSDLIADLADCISHGETREAMVAVHKLATIPNPPIAVLVTAAAADEHETAGAAQVSIDRLLRRWQRDVESKKRYGRITSQLSELAKSLAGMQSEFSDADYPWIESTVRRILRIANKFPPATTPLVAAHCDAILTAIGAGDFRAREDESPDFNDFNDFDDVIAGMPEDKSYPQSELAPSSDAGQDTRQSANDKAHSIETAVTPLNPPTATEPLSYPADGTPRSSSDDEVVNELRSRSDEVDEHAATDRMSSNPVLPLRSVGAPPIFRILPAMPVYRLPNDAEVSNRKPPDSPASTEGPVDASSESLKSAGSRELLQTWLASENGNAQSIERQLAARGFGKVSKRLVRQYFSDNPQDRIRLLDNVLAQPGSGSEAWLILLAEDSDPDVRLFAVTFMATSKNAALLEKAWQVAIRDRDPRVADVASRLRERREGPLRR